MRKFVKGLLFVVFFLMVMATVIFVGNGFNEHNTAHFFIGIGCLVLCTVDYTILYVSTLRR